MNTLTEPGTQPSAQDLVRRLIEDVINGRDYSLLPDLLHADYVHRTPGEELEGGAALKALLDGYRVAFPDLSIGVDSIFSSCEWVATAFTLSGTHEGPLLGIPATGRSVAVHGVIHSRVKDGRIAEEWELIDMAGLLEQLKA